jgi:hypothetical protein
MIQPHAFPTPPGMPAWDITLTRMTQAVRPQLLACVHALARRFEAIGLRSDLCVRQTPRGLSTFLSLVGRRGLVCILDLTLVDGLAVGRGPSAALDIRLLDACGDVVTDGFARGMTGLALPSNGKAVAFAAADLDRAATSVYIATLAQFDLLQPGARSS